MNPIVFALRRPITVMMLVLALALGGIYSIGRMQKDIFPSLNQPVLYVIHNYGGMDPKQIEGLITNQYELFFQYVNNVEHVESRSIQSMVMLGSTSSQGPIWPRRPRRDGRLLTAPCRSCPTGRCRRTWSGSTRGACRSAISYYEQDAAPSASSRTRPVPGPADVRRPGGDLVAAPPFGNNIRLRSSSTSTPTASAPTTSRPRTSSPRSTAATSSARPATWRSRTC